MHSKGIEMDYEEIHEIIAKYSLDDPVAEIMSDYIKSLKNPILDTEEKIDEYINEELEYLE